MKCPGTNANRVRIIECNFQLQLRLQLQFQAELNTLGLNTLALPADYLGGALLKHSFWGIDYGNLNKLQLPANMARVYLDFQQFIR